MPVDLVIRGGTVYDGTGSQPFSADVAVLDDRIAAVGRAPESADAAVVDATGLAVCPGFINILSHSYFSLQQDPHGVSELVQGVTTEVFGEGISIGPSNGDILDVWRQTAGGLDVSFDFGRSSDFLRFLESRGVAPNVASFVGAHNLRMLEAGEENRSLTPAEVDRSRGVLREELEDGALGVASALIYPAGAFADTDELVGWCEVVGEYDGLYISHLRSEGDRFLEALDELLEIGQRAGCRAEVYHLKAAGRSNWPKMTQAIERIQASRDDGREVTADMYPYEAGATALASSIPPPFHEGGRTRLLHRLADAGARQEMVAAVRDPSDRWENLYRAAGGAEGVVLLTDAADGTQLRGRSLAQVARERGVDPVETLLDIVAADPGMMAAYFIVSPDNIAVGLAQPWVSIGSDAQAVAPVQPFTAESVHPRSYGTFARVLGTYVRERSVLSLPEAVRRMTSLPADNLRLADRGRLTAGAFADIVVFDPVTVADHATYAQPHQLATGVRHVVVNGQQVVRDGAFTGVLPGRALRRSK